MKKMMMTMMLMMVLSISKLFGMSTSQIRTNARFLSDRMAYELDLTPRQYDDVYEINYDYIYAINRIMDDVVRGYRAAINDYYDLLDERNDDLSYVLTSRQYREFMASEYFYRPVYSTGRTWAFRIHTIYSNHTFYYYDAPTHFKIYAGAHSHRNHKDYYHGRWADQKHDRYVEKHVIRGSEHSGRYEKHDFGVTRRDPKGNDKNHYGNANDKNREKDSRYEHSKGNQNSPRINHRANESSRDNSVAKQPTQTRNDKSAQTRNDKTAQKKTNNRDNNSVSHGRR